MDSALSFVVLAVGFIVLVWTFVWVARLMALPDEVTTGSAKTASTGESAADGTRRVKGRGYGANYGLVLGLAGCALFFMWPSPLLLALAAVGMFHSARAVFRGLYYFGVVVWRALIGVAFNGGLPIMLYLHTTGQWSPPFLDVGLGLT
jgi:hypothetical protein